MPDHSLPKREGEGGSRLWCWPFHFMGFDSLCVCVCVCPEFSPHVCPFLSCKRTCFAFCSIFTRTIWGFTSFLRSATRLLPTSWSVHAAIQTRRHSQPKRKERRTGTLTPLHISPCFVAEQKQFGVIQYTGQQNKCVRTTSYDEQAYLKAVLESNGDDVPVSVLRRDHDEVQELFCPSTHFRKPDFLLGLLCSEYPCPSGVLCACQPCESTPPVLVRASRIQKKGGGGGEGGEKGRKTTTRAERHRNTRTHTFTYTRTHILIHALSLSSAVAADVPPQLVGAERGRAGKSG